MPGVAGTGRLLPGGGADRPGTTDLDAFLHALEPCNELGSGARLLRQTVNELRQLRLHHTNTTPTSSLSRLLTNQHRLSSAKWQLSDSVTHLKPIYPYY